MERQESSSSVSNLKNMWIVRHVCVVLTSVLPWGETLEGSEHVLS